MSSITVYFDESGYTGENLLSEDQPTFSYATVTIDSERANNLVTEILEKYPKQTQSGELKATTLLKTDKGKEAILEILNKLKDNIKVSVSDKKYALSAKFFEYIFEPVLAEKSTIFYGINFHKYISNVIYMSFAIGNDVLAKELIIRFEKLMRSKSEDSLDNLIALYDENIQVESNSTEQIKNILFFIKINRDLIFAEINALPKWTVDLSITALNALFSELGKSGDEIIAYCDNSKPIFEQKDIFNPMLGRKEVLHHFLFTNDGNPIPITYNLKELNLEDSREYKAIQLADIVAGSASYVFKMFENKEDVFSLKVKNILFPNLVYGSIFPDFEHINLKKKSVQFNLMLFEQVIECCKNGRNVLDDIESYLTFMNNTLDEKPFLESN